MTQITIAGKKYNTEVINGVIIVDGYKIDEFIETLDPNARMDLANIGYEIAINGNTSSPQKMANELHSKRNN
jgi:hypothetical protein